MTLRLEFLRIQFIICLCHIRRNNCCAQTGKPAVTAVVQKTERFQVPLVFHSSGCCCLLKLCRGFIAYGAEKLTHAPGIQQGCSQSRGQLILSQLIASPNMVNLGNAQKLGLFKPGKQVLQPVDYPWGRPLCFRLFSIPEAGYLLVGCIFPGCMCLYHMFLSPMFLSRVLLYRILLYPTFLSCILLPVSRSALSECRMCL